MTRDLALRDFFNTTVSNFFNEPVRYFRFPREYNTVLQGKADFEEHENGYSLELEVPGVDKEEIKIDLKDDILTINWNRKREQEKSKSGYYERSEGSFSRRFSVKGADQEKVQAELKNGILKIELAKQEEAKVKNIQIN